MISKKLFLFLAISIFSASSFANNEQNLSGLIIDTPSCIQQDFPTDKMLSDKMILLSDVDVNAGTLIISGASYAVAVAAVHFARPILIITGAVGTLAGTGLGGVFGVSAGANAGFDIGDNDASAYVGGTVGGAGGAAVGGTVGLFAGLSGGIQIISESVYTAGESIVYLVNNFHDHEDQKKFFSNVLEKCQSSAENGDAKAQTLLGYLFLKGIGTDKYTELALRYLELAVDQNHKDAIDILEAWELEQKRKKMIRYM